MKKILRFLPIFTIAAGIVCALLRQSLFAAADSRGLLPLDHYANTWLLLVSALYLTLIAFHSNVFQQNRRYCFRFPVQAIGCLAAAVGHFWWYTAASESFPLFSVLKLAAGVLFLVLAAYRFCAKKPPLAIFAGISLCMMILCFGQYRQWGQFTQVQEYLSPALSALFIALYSLEACYMELPEHKSTAGFYLSQAALITTLTCIDSNNLPYNLAMSIWLISGLFTSPYRMTLPQDVLHLMDKLEKAGFTVYAVGGCVRDAILGLTPHDYDLCTNATPEQICEVFPNYQLIRNGEKHGTIGVVLEHNVYEITTYRTEGNYSDNRHPDEVTFVDRIEEDLARRDFTVNAMAFHPKTGYIDPFDGQKDLQKGILRAVGDPETRFREDALRILRGVRFACRFRLTPEKKTLQAMKNLTPLLEHLAKERVYSEVTQSLCLMEDDDLLTYQNILLQVIPELAPCVDFLQHNPHHKYDVFTHTAYVLTSVENNSALRWAALLHDAGKPQTFTQDEKGIGHFYGHAKESAQIANDVLHRLKAPTELREQVVFLIQHHIDTLSGDKALLRKKLSKYGADNLRKLIALQRADQAGKGTAKNDRSFEKMLQALEQLEKAEGRLQIRDLAIDGHDLMALGFEPGPALGACQKQLLELVLSGEIPNEKSALTQKAEEILNQ
ncbi:MAG: HD domain-containing protein [Oscillospiraceae bacterium]|nr:HD domain-containing protein [Oscillospiraceae bacterium]